MAKSKHNRSGSGFDRLSNDAPDTPPPLVTTPSTVVEVPEEDESDNTEPTDVVPPEELPASTPPTETDAKGTIPFGAFRRLDEALAKATTMQDQEAIIAKMHSPCKIEDPADHYKGCLVKGHSLPKFKVRDDADPLLIRCKDFLERILAGGLIVPTAYTAYTQGLLLVADVRTAIQCPETAEGKSDAQSDPRSAGGEEKVVGGAQ